MSTDATPTLTVCPVTKEQCGCARVRDCPHSEHYQTQAINLAMDAEWARLQQDSRELARLKYGLTELERALLALTREAHDFSDRLDGILALLRRVAGAGE